MENTTSAATATSSAAEQRANIEFKYKGVRKRKWGKYVCEVRLPNSRERIWLGSYDTAEKAARAFDAALFCLRGRNAKFNFPDDLPNITGWQALTPAEIQAVAQHYGNTFGGGGSSQQAPPQSGDAELGPPVAESKAASPPGGVGNMGSMDWSFLDVLDLKTAGSSGHVSDFGLFHEPADMYLPPHLNEEEDNGNGGNVSSSLWNF